MRHYPPAGEDRASFLNPDSLRDQLSRKLAESANYERAMAVADEFDRLARAYNHAFEGFIEEYLAHLSQPNWSSESIEILLEPLDERRTKTLGEIVRLRQSLLEILTPDEWQRVFG